MFNPDYHPKKCTIFNKLPGVYTNAWRAFGEKGGTSPVDFLIFCQLSLKMGIILDEDDIASVGFSPLQIFAALLKYYDPSDTFPDFNMDAIASEKDIYATLVTLELKESPDILLEHLSHRPSQKVRYFLDIVARTKNIRATVINYLESIGLTQSEYKNYQDLIDTMREVREGFADERRSALQKDLKARFPVLGSDILLAILLAFELDALLILLDVNEVSNNTEYTGLFGTELITVKAENELFDLIERLDDYFKERNEVFCCSEHGFVPASKIPSCNAPDSLRKITENIFSRKFSQFIDFTE